MKDKNDHSVLSPYYWFDKLGVEPKDIPKAFITFKTISYVSYGATFALCYRYKPTKMFLQTNMGKNVIMGINNRFPTFIPKLTEKANTLTTKMATNKYFQKIPESIGLKSKRFSKAFVENFFFYKLGSPVMVPLFLFGSVKYVQHTKIGIKTPEK
ncbi:MAG: hypothetical protein Terrestrivirus3_70 [Terrestrivirus sp.]|uniref:Uncharacterized protein n=1 Tax=Terrestrivirus sp. TaxID=2487775 RepID=A0A3G4ZPB4_9VIRU|nr:MAG: hypothetical protein Terrestrivirus3_70 [Terrestrivirus sp.]